MDGWLVDDEENIPPTFARADKSSGLNFLTVLYITIIDPMKKSHWAWGRDDDHVVDLFLCGTAFHLPCMHAFRRPSIAGQFDDYGISPVEYHGTYYCFSCHENNAILGGDATRATQSIYMTIMVLFSGYLQVRQWKDRDISKTNKKAWQWHFAWTLFIVWWHMERHAMHRRSARSTCFRYPLNNLM